MEVFLESIRCWDGELQALAAHQARVDRTFARFFLDSPPLSLLDLAVPDHARRGLYKCRLTYGPDLLSLDFEPYQPRAIQCVQLVDSCGLRYDYKWANRSGLQALLEQRGAADDVLIVRDGLLTDSSYANVALYDGREWHTPREPLLMGTQREGLIASGQLVPRDIRVQDMSGYRALRLFNAMLPWSEALQPTHILKNDEPLLMYGTSD